MEFSLPVLTFLMAVALSKGGENVAITRSLRVYADTSCRMVRAGEATDAQLEDEVYQPLARQLLTEMKQVFGQARSVSPGLKADAKPGGQTTYRNPSVTEDGGFEAIAGPDAAMITSAAGSVANVIIDNYQDAYRERHRDTPAAASFHDDQPTNRTRITSDIRDYCSKLDQMGITELFPKKQGSRRSDAPGEP